MNTVKIICRNVGHDGLVSIDGVLYQAPVCMAGQVVTINTDTLEIFAQRGDAYLNIEEAISGLQALTGMIVLGSQRRELKELIVGQGLSRRYVAELASELNAEYLAALAQEPSVLSLVVYHGPTTAPVPPSSGSQKTA